MDNKQCKICYIEKDYTQKGLSPVEDRQIWVIGSKEIIDSDGDIINVRGVQLDTFNKNPVVLSQHNWSGDSVGKVIETKQVGDSLYFKLNLQRHKKE